MKIALLITSLSMFLTPVCAQKMSLNDCMRYAVEHNTEVNKQSYQNYIYKQDKLNAVGKLLPSVSGGSSVYRGDGKYLNSNNNTYNEGSSFGNSYNLSASMPIFNGFAGINSVRASHMNLLMGKETLQQYKDDRALKTMEQYFNVVYFTKNVQDLKEKLETSQKTLLKSQKMAELGMKSDADVAVLAASAATDALILTQGENNLEEAILLLKKDMNYPFEDTLDIEIDLPIEMMDGDIQLLNISESALERNPKMLASQYRLKNSQLQYAIYKGYMLPSLSVGASYDTEYQKDLKSSMETVDFGTQLKSGKIIRFSASLNIPIFQGFERRTNARRAKAQMKISEMQNLNTQREVQLEMAQTSMKLNGYAKEFIEATKSVESCDLAYKLSQMKFEKGLVDAMDLQTSANNLLAAKSKKLQARLYYLLKYRLVEYYNGLPLIREQ